MTERRHVPVVLVGGGAACAAAVVQLARAGIEAVMIAPSLGGLVRNAWRVENFPGFPEGIGGADLAGRIVRHITKSGVEVLNDTVGCIDVDGDGFVVRTAGRDIGCDHVVVGTGTAARRLGIDGEDQAVCAGLLGYEFTAMADAIDGKRIVIVGAGDVAYDYALNCADRAGSVMIVQRSETPRSLAVLQQAVKRKANITVLTERRVLRVVCSGADQLTLETAGPGGDGTIAGDGVLAAVGRRANLNMLGETLLDDRKEVPAVPGLFVIGDAAHPACRHVAVAMGDGVRCAMEIETRLRER